MHSLPNQSSVWRFRLVAFLVLLKWMFFTGAVGLLGFSMLKEHRGLAYVAIGVMGLAVVVSISHWVVGARARCPLCMVPSFSHQQCSKNRKATHIFGSYRLVVALAVIFKGYFRCPYCGEPTAIAARPRLNNLRR